MNPTQAGEAVKFNFCACMGPRPGDLYCPCRMQREGIPMKNPLRLETEEETAAMRERLRKAFEEKP